MLSYRSIPLKVVRTGKWTVDESFTPSVYPVSALGTSYILSRKAVDLMSTTYFSKSYPGLWIEDVYLTGVLREGNTFFTHTLKPKRNKILYKRSLPIKFTFCFYYFRTGNTLS